MKVSTLIALVLMALQVFSITPDEIVRASRSDVDEALRLFHQYIKENPDDVKGIERLGKILYSKKELEKTPFEKAARSENADELLKVISKSKSPIDERTFELLRTIFSDLDKVMSSKIVNLDAVAISACRKLPAFVEIPSSEFSDRLLKAYLLSSVPVGLEDIGGLRCVENLDEVVEKIVEDLKEFLGRGENFYMKVFYTIETLNLPLKDFGDLKDYAELATRLETLDPLSVTPQEYSEMVEEYESIDMEKDLIKRKLLRVAMNLASRGVDLSGLCDDPELCPKTVVYEENRALKSESHTLEIAIAVAFGAVLTTIVMVSRNPKVRLKRLKKKVSKDPLNVDLHLKLARLYEDLGMVEEAMREYKIASDIVGSGSD